MPLLDAWCLRLAVLGNGKALGPSMCCSKVSRFCRCSCGSAVEPCSPLINNVNTPQRCLTVVESFPQSRSSASTADCAHAAAALRKEASRIIAHSVDIWYAVEFAWVRPSKPLASLGHWCSRHSNFACAYSIINICAVSRVSWSGFKQTTVRLSRQLWQTNFIFFQSALKPIQFEKTQTTGKTIVLF